ncbi:MAG: class I SAM-dependent methyltransferase [Myxococcales bacterium]
MPRCASAAARRRQRSCRRFARRSATRRKLFYRFGFQAMGGPDDGRRVVEEHGLRFEVALLPHRNTGLFLDAREARRWVRAHAEGRRILNLFAYTCAFGVAAAAGGARATTNVDAVPSTLEKGRRNYELNGLRADGRTFLKSDVLEALKRARKSNAGFDGIVLHPPPVATGGDRGRRTDGAKDFEKLVAACRAVLAPGGWLLVAWTATAFPLEALDAAVQLGPPREVIRSGEDFTQTEEQPALRALAYFAP